MIGATIYATTRQECDHGAADVLWLYCRAMCWYRRGGGGRGVRCDDDMHLGRGVRWDIYIPALHIYVCGGIYMRPSCIYASRTVVISLANPQNMSETTTDPHLARVRGRVRVRVRLGLGSGSGLGLGSGSRLGSGMGSGSGLGLESGLGLGSGCVEPHMLASR